MRRFCRALEDIRTSTEQGGGTGEPTTPPALPLTPHPVPITEATQAIKTQDVVENNNDSRSDHVGYEADYYTHLTLTTS